MMRRLLLLRRSCYSTRRPQLASLSTISRSRRRVPNDGLTLADFVSNEKQAASLILSTADDNAAASFHMKTYGCQMNVSDSDIVRSLLLKHGMTEVSLESEADVLLTNTCAIREGAETKVWHRLQQLKHNKKKQLVGVLGCMAERLKEKLLENSMADLVVGPDAYRDLPKLMDALLQEDVDTAVNVQLSLEETYADITPVRHNPKNPSAFLSIMRGCNNMCSYCVVPFTRGRERSRPLESIVSEVQYLLEEKDIKEVVLLGQNVNSYHDTSKSAVEAMPLQTYQTSNDGFSNLYRLRGGAGYYFCDLVEQVASLSPELRVRFTSPHPKDYPPELLQLMAETPNVCNQLHMPAQSGSSTVLQRMRRGYTREAYLELMDSVHSTIPDVAISSDFITGFCGETENEHCETLSLLRQVQYDQAFMFAYSMREKTHAHRKLRDDISTQVKQRRLQEIITTFRTIVQQKNNEQQVGRLRLVLVEGDSKKSKPERITWHGRTDQNKRIVFPMPSDLHTRDDGDVQSLLAQLQQQSGGGGLEQTNARVVPLQIGDYAVVQVTEARGHTLRGQLLWRTTLSKFAEMNLSLADEELLKEVLATSNTAEPMTA